MLLALSALGPPADTRTAGTAQGGAAEVLLPAIADRGLALEAVRRELVGLGEEVSRELLAIAAARRVVVRVAEREVRLDLRPELVDTVLDALADLPSRCRADLFDAIVAGAPDPAERLAALALLERVGEAEHLPLALKLAGDASTASSVGPEEAMRFEEAAAGCLSRVRSHLPPLVRLYGEAHPALAAALVRAIAREHSTVALQRIGTLLGHRPELDAFALARFATVAARLPALQPDSVRAPVRALLSATLPEVVAGAASVAGLLEDPLAAPRLCALLHEPDVQVRGAAVDALRRIAARDLGEDPIVWYTWCESEAAWWAGEAPELLEFATSGAVPEACSAIVAISRQRLHRHEQAAVLVRCLERAETEVACLAADALGALRSPLAVEALGRARCAGDQRLGESARRALERIAAANAAPR